MGASADSLTLEDVSLNDIPEPKRAGRGNGKYFAILTNFVDGGREAAVVHYDGDALPATVAAYMRKLVDREGWNITVMQRDGRVFLVRNQD